MLTGIKDLDFKILNELDDHELYDICIINRKSVEVCNDENFWRNRFMTRFAPDILNAKPNDMTWKDYYIELSNSEELEGGDRLWYIDPKAKLFFENANFGDYLGKPLNEYLIETAGVSTNRNLKYLLIHYVTKCDFTYFNEIFREEIDKYSINIGNCKYGGIMIDKVDIDRWISLVLKEPLRTNTLLYNKMYTLYVREKKILKQLININQ